MKKRTQPRQTTALVLGLTAGVLLAACSPPPPPCLSPPICYTYGEEFHLDVERMFGDEVEEDGSSKTYIATWVKTDKSEKEEDLVGWKGQYEITFTTTTEKRKVGDEEHRILNFSAKLPDDMPAEHKEVAPETGTLALVKKTDSDISVTRFIGKNQDTKFKDGKLEVHGNGDLIFTYRIEGVDPASAPLEDEKHIFGTPNATWEFFMCSNFCPDDVRLTFTEKQYGEYKEDIKRIFGDYVKEYSSQSYIATKVKTDRPWEEDLSGWRNKYEISLFTSTGRENEGPVLRFHASQIPVAYLEMAPRLGNLVLVEKTGNQISVTRFIRGNQDEHFKDGKLKVNDDGSLVLTHRIEDVHPINDRSELRLSDYGTLNATWEFTLKKKE